MDAYRQRLHARAEFFTVLQKVTLPVLLGDASIGVRQTAQGYAFRIVVKAPCNVTGAPAQHTGRWWTWDTSDSIPALVRSLFLAVKVYAEHELAEQFRFDGDAVFFPDHT